MTRFVILAVPRTGSNLLCTLLNSHPQILCHHEVFNPQGVFTALDYHGPGLKVDSLRERDEHPLAFVGRVWQTGNDHACVGFKWTTGQNRQVLESVLADSRIKKIVLRRRNRIKTYVSERIAQETQQWELYQGQKLTMPRPKIHVDTTQLLQRIAENQQFYAHVAATLEQSHQPYLALEYETLFDRQIQLGIFEFLAVSQPKTPPTAASVKQNPNDLRATVANFAELAASLPDDELVAELRDCGM